jgi:hypothetical protein
VHGIGKRGHQEAPQGSSMAATGRAAGEARPPVGDDGLGIGAVTSLGVDQARTHTGLG